MSKACNNCKILYTIKQKIFVVVKLTIFDKEMIPLTIIEENNEKKKKKIYVNICLLTLFTVYRCLKRYSQQFVLAIPI